MKALFSVLLACVLFAACKPSTVVNFDNPNIHYSGRVGIKKDAAELIWTASSVVVNFEGTGADAVLSDSKGADMITVVADGKVVQTLKPKKNKQKTYELVSGLQPGKHRLELFKRTEYQVGTLSFYGLKLHDEGKILPPPVYKHRIEFYANSITCGFALEDTTGKDRDEGFQNGYRSYANITARHFNAQYHCIAKSGIGVVLSWLPYIMPEIYDRTYPMDPKSKWDFSKFTPEIVIVNLFQNDYHTLSSPTHPQFKARFGTTRPSAETIIAKYQDFIKSIRNKYPDAKIICALGSMDSVEPGSPFPGYVEKAVATLGDKNVYSQIFPYLGAHRHPNAREHEAMAKQLISFIETKFGWKGE
ncbi:hypothetical protein BC343_01485 [Mucilaginibacter pedocola]|uniref:Carbohydrate esterase 2 N-terminal domain-containing protein n=1 Tax=Mucilaginibacter pedocola TaxID=1792845 RepID=A0A1S9PMU8_9SPHI|nr:hypothetical protein BC343_01485 [Mucilaginibacter pedocola]